MCIGQFESAFSVMLSTINTLPKFQSVLLISLLLYSVILCQDAIGLACKADDTICIKAVTSIQITGMHRPSMQPQGSAHITAKGVKPRASYPTVTRRSIIQGII